MALRLAAAWFAGALSWLHIQDFEFDAAIELGLLPHFLSGPARRSERFLLRRFQAVSSISPRMVDRLEGKGVPRERTAMFPNWVDTRRIRPDADGAAFRAELGIGADTVVALYSGNIGEKQGIEQIATAAKYVSENRGPGDPPVRFVLAGAGAGREVIEQAVRAHGLGEDAFTLLPLQPEEKLPVLLAMADIHLLPQRAEAADLVMPSKLGACCPAAVLWWRRRRRGPRSPELCRAAGQLWNRVTATPSARPSWNWRAMRMRGCGTGRGGGQLGS